MSLDEAFNWAIKMHPNELQNMGWGWVNPLPQNGQELKKAFKDGAVSAKEKTKETVKEGLNKANEIFGEPLRGIWEGSKLIPPRTEIINRGYWPIFLTPWIMEEMKIEEQENIKRYLGINEKDLSI